MRLPGFRTALGTDAETRAQRHLEKAGLRLQDRNWRCARGELDLVMLDREELVFVEVRSRGRSDYGGAAASVDARKQKRIVQAARAWLQAHPQHTHRAMRFDVVAFEHHGAPDWLRQAFDAQD